MLTREQLVKPKTKTISIGDGDVVIRALTAAEAFELRGKDIQKEEIFGIISKSLIDPALTTEDVGMLSASDVTQLTTEIFVFNALGKKAVEEAKGELKKTEGSTTNLPAS
jgi:hypothetical protein